MSKEMQVDFETGANVYFVRMNADGQVALTDGSAFEDWGAGGHDADDYDVAASEVGTSGHYVADFDVSSNIAAGRYTYKGYVRLGANPVDGDDKLGSALLVWNGTAEVFGFETDGGLVAAAIADVNAQADTALSDYDPPTKTELNTAVDDIKGSDGDDLKDISDQIDNIPTVGGQPSLGD